MEHGLNVTVGKPLQFYGWKTHYPLSCCKALPISDEIFFHENPFETMIFW